MAAEHRQRRVPLIFLVLLPVLLALVAMILWNVSRPVIDARVQAIRAAGYAVTLQEMDAAYKRPADVNNAALIYTNAFARPLLASNLANDYTVSNWLPPRGRPANEADKAEFEALLATNKEAMDLLYQAATLGATRYPIDLTQGAFTLLPHLSKIKSATAILATEGVILAQDRKNKEAVRTFVAASKVADSVAEEPLMISQLVYYAAWNVICADIEKALSLGSFNEDELLELQRVVTAGERTNSLALALAGERSGSLAVFTEVRHQTAMISGQWGSTTSGERLKTQLAMGLMKATGVFTKDKDFFLDNMSNFVWAAEQPHPERWKQTQLLPSPLAPSRFWVFSRMLLPALGKATKKDVEHAARIRAAQTALAIERFRMAHTNALPETLSELTTAFCPSVPLDPFDGTALHYKRLQRGYVVYSIGADGKDDGGTEYNSKNPAGYDITFTVEK